MTRGKKKAAVDAGPVEGPWDLPVGWRWERLGGLAEFINGAAFKPTDWHGEGRPIIRIQNLTDPNKRPNLTRRELPEKYVVNAGDILMSWSATLDVYEWRGPTAWLNQHIFKIADIRSDIDQRYLRFLLKNEIETLKRSDHLHGSTMMHINRGPFMAHPVPVPPHHVQVAISARIDALFAEVDAGEAALADARSGVETYRKSLLKAAVMGELTADWRHDNPPQETGADLLRQILSDRRTRWHADPKNKKKKYTEPVGPDTDGLSELPEGWVWASTDMLTSGLKGDIVIGPFGSDLKVSDYTADGVPLVFVRNIRAKDFAGLRPQFVSVDKANELSAHEALPGDILITKMGDPPGDVAIYPDRPKAIITADCIRWRASGKTNHKFLEIWISSFWGQAWIKSKTKGVAQQKITLELFRQMPVAVPSISEQHEIVRLASRKQSELDDLIEPQGSELSSTLRQSILAAAFRGELTP